VCSVWWWLAWLVGDPSWRWRPMIANGHPISSWPRNKYSWSLSLSLSFSLCIYCIHTYKHSVLKKSARSLLVFLSLFFFLSNLTEGRKKKIF
jgi:hypothetical protein